jgi:hypothetical protein
MKFSESLPKRRRMDAFILRTGFYVFLWSASGCSSDGSELGNPENKNEVKTRREGCLLCAGASSIEPFKRNNIACPSGLNIFYVNTKGKDKEKKFPDIAIWHSDGWIVGTDTGEWGGELAFVGDNGGFELIANGRVGGILRVDSGFLTIFKATGLVPEGRGGSLAQIIENNNQSEKRFSIVNLLELRGKPVFECELTDGSFLIETDEKVKMPNGGSYYHDLNVLRDGKTISNLFNRVAEP